MIFNNDEPMIIISNDTEIIEFKNNIQIKFPFITKELVKAIIIKNNIKNIQDIVFMDIKEFCNKPLILVFFEFEKDKILCLVKNSVVFNQKEKNRVMEVNLREPITSIFSMFPVLADNINKDKTEKAMQNLEAMQRQSYILLKNINNISLTNRILQGEEFLSSNIDLSSFLKSLTMSVSEVINNIEIKTNIKDGLIIKASKHLLSAGILALISNSIKYKQEKIIINIELYEKKGRCVIVYKDNSIGIKDELVTEVFNSYYSKDPHNDSEFSHDIGVGLFILKTAIENAKGTVFLTSEFSKGVNYSISIPINNDTEDVLLSKSSDYLMNRYSEMFVQLSEYCILPDL